MKTDPYKNKNPILLKLCQITALLIGSAFFTVQAAPTVNMGPVNDWMEFNDGAYSRGFDLHIFDTTNEIAQGAHYEVTIEYDSNLISIDFNTDGAITFSGDYNPDDPMPSLIAEFDIFTSVLNFDTILNITSATLDGVSIGSEKYDLQISEGPEVSTVPLPAAFPLMLSAIAAVGFLGSKRKKLIPQS
jgi:hypothetical protein